ncbi:AraC-type DNA-binding protein [Lihuaxuella thermophila]|uniref:AraC-type DNA-binding protein n=2 Tax=Lihuaxuella thermophila TaxID=1173111 RepID=A0A1H8AMN4_9BACL|nr:AraC-type DNA-binding protein [Lihuaxuella thermophila]
MLSHFHHLYADGEIRLFGVRLLPWGLSALSEKPVRCFNDRFVPLQEVFAPKSADLLPQLERKLADTLDISMAQELLEAFLLDLYAPDRIDPKITRVLAKLYGDPMTYDIARAVRDSGYSQRQFERRCAELTGLSPKRLHKIARFNQARLRLMFQPDLDLHECMLEFGYYDYAHFSKDFKLCLGVTPVQYCKWVRQMAAKLHGSQDVVFLQDEP